jgi:hypothetical protein
MSSRAIYETDRTSTSTQAFAGRAPTPIANSDLELDFDLIDSDAF